MGLIKIKALARNYCYWEKLDKDIEKTVSECRECYLKRNKSPKTELNLWELPQ